MSRADRILATMSRHRREQSEPCSTEGCGRPREIQRTVCVVCRRQRQTRYHRAETSCIECDAIIAERWVSSRSAPSPRCPDCQTLLRARSRARGPHRSGGDSVDRQRQVRDWLEARRPKWAREDVVPEAAWRRDGEAGWP